MKFEQYFSFNKIHLKMSVEKWRTFFPGVAELRVIEYIPSHMQIIIFYICYTAVLFLPICFYPYSSGSPPFTLGQSYELGLSCDCRIFNGCTIEVLIWISNFIPHLEMDGIIIHAGIKVNPRQSKVYRGDIKCPITNKALMRKKFSVWYVLN